MMMVPVLRFDTWASFKPCGIGLALGLSSGESRRLVFDDTTFIDV